jgi:hypothetical protein
MPIDLRSQADFTPPHPDCPDPHLWHTPDGQSSEAEVTEFLQALLGLIKPRIAVESGTWHGATTVALASALRRNGRGHLYGLEIDPKSAVIARRRVEQQGLSPWATVLETSSLTWTPPGKIDFAYLDAAGGWHRAWEFLALHPAMHPGTVVCVHDTSRPQRVPRLAFKGLAARGLIRPVWLHCPRGLLIGQPGWPSAPRQAAGLPMYYGYRLYTLARGTARRLARSRGLR